MGYRQNYEQWLNSEFIDSELKEEIKNIKDEKEIEDRFYKNLEFGTGGLRGIMGAGSNRMNIHTVGKATQGLSDYLLDKYKGERISVSIAYDSRNNSEKFAKEAARIFCANGITVNLFDSLRPTPMLSFTIRHLNCKAGVVVTASHNPKEYNGYKVYGEDGGQITDNSAEKIISYINKIKDFSVIKIMDYNEAIEKGLLNIIGEDVDKAYFSNVKSLTIRKELVEEHAKDLKIIYTPLHGSGNIPVRRVLRELGYENLSVVKEQELPDGNFPTVSYPNPEEKEVFNYALNMAKSLKPDIIFGTDPDCDRIGVVIKDSTGEYKTLTGNQTGILLTNYIVKSMKEMGKLSDKDVVVKTIVSTDMVRKILNEYGVELIEVLTGFKYIGEKIKEFNESGNKSFLFGFEESYGYLAGDFVRDKDAVIAAMLICEMTLYYKNKGMSLYDALVELYEKYGYYKEELVSIKLEGKEGREKIAKVLDFFRNNIGDEINGVNIIDKKDYITGIDNLPKSNVLKFTLEDNSWFVVRPSGTEPKMKIYFSVTGESSNDAEMRLEKFKNNIINIVEDIIK
ncbi:phosphoglucomutase [Clostridium tepidiprofundi DSM 19306]|uniref:Phosphoglucomutase n=1 Tax=Clostridium tepidiprofundi DSM 19306 TaxID=1121338 RepID=A0A151B4Z4_9CLOT|nr:phospho-sugar mutase [Clostridium tepidiprofundi]KYH34727.1 phosphoglucomutase [Clostridium tepidiprofundi DSM 19306]